MQKSKVVSSLMYKFVERFSAKGIGLFIGIILARIISPDEFGQVAIIMVFINLATTMIQSGFSASLVQVKDVDDKDYSTVFYITTALSAIIVLLLWVCSPYIAEYYEMPNLTWPIRVYSFSLFFGSFNSIQVARLQREMRFKPMMYTSLIATMLSGVLGVVLAYMGVGIWALVVYGCSNIVFSCITMLFVAKWYPKFIFSWKRAGVLFSFGWKMLVSGMLCSVYNDARSLIIGKRYSVDDLAYYNRGQQYPEVISNTIETSIQSVMFPAMARSQSDKEQMLTMLKKTISLGVFIITPVMMGLAAVAPSLILLLLTEKWMQSVIYMQIICLATISLSFIIPSLTAIKAMGRSDIYMKLELIRRIVMLAILLVALFVFDYVLAIAISYVISSIIDMFIASAPLKKLLDYDGFKQVKDNWKTLVASLIMGIGAYSVGFLQLPTIVLLLLQMSTGVLIYVLLCIAMRIESFHYVLSLVKKVIPHKK